MLANPLTSELELLVLGSNVAMHKSRKGVLRHIWFMKLSSHWMMTGTITERRSRRRRKFGAFMFFFSLFFFRFFAGLKLKWAESKTEVWWLVWCRKLILRLFYSVFHFKKRFFFPILSSNERLVRGFCLSVYWKTLMLSYLWELPIVIPFFLIIFHYKIQIRVYHNLFLKVCQRV